MELALVSDWKRHPCEEAQLEEIFAKEFAARGHKVHWCAFIPGLPEAERRETWHGHPITLFRRDRSVQKRLKGWLSALLAERPIDLVQVRNDPGFAWTASSLARRAGKPFVFHLSILNGPVLLDEAWEEPWHKRPAQWLKGVVGGALVDRAALGCDLLLPISPAMADHYRQLGRTAPSEPLPMGCRPAAFTPPAEGRGFVEALYLGAMDRGRKLDFLLRAFAKARRSRPELRLAFLGSSRRPASVEELKDLARELGAAEHVRFEALIPRAEVPARIARADFGVSPVPPTPYYMLSSPTKLMECLGAGRPVVANDIPEQKAVLDASGGGACVPYDEDAFAAALAAMAGDAAARVEMGRRGAEYMARERDYSVLASKVEDAYRKHLGVGARAEKARR